MVLHIHTVITYPYFIKFFPPIKNQITLLPFTWVATYLQHVELIVLVALEALRNSSHGARRLVPEVEQGRLVVGEDMGEHVTSTGRQEVDLLHRVQLKLIKPSLCLLHLSLNLDEQRGTELRVSNLVKPRGYHYFPFLSKGQVFMVQGAKY